MSGGEAASRSSCFWVKRGYENSFTSHFSSLSYPNARKPPAWPTADCNADAKDTTVLSRTEMV